MRRRFARSAASRWLYARYGTAKMPATSFGAARLTRNAGEQETRKTRTEGSRVISPVFFAGDSRTNNIVKISCSDPETIHSGSISNNFLMSRTHRTRQLPQAGVCSWTPFYGHDLRLQ
jgi:hypothetical protein